MWLESLTHEELRELQWHWPFWARPNQLAPAWDWETWLLLAGRGFGKTRTLVEWIRDQATRATCEWIAIIGPTHDDVHKAIIEGESGILATAHPGFFPSYLKHQQLTWPNGVKALLYSAEEPDRLRNKQHEKAACDEVAAWKYPKSALEQLDFTLRLGRSPQVVIATTPRPIQILRSMVRNANGPNPSVALTAGSSYDNVANLSEKYVANRIAKYEGTRLGRQEIYAEILEDVQGALWTHEMFDALRVDKAVDLQRTVVAVDPSGGEGDDHDAQGIGAAGVGIDGHLYALADRTCSLSPQGWARRTVETAIEFDADAIVYEKNYGGDMVKNTIEVAQKSLDNHTRLIGVTASKGKHQRAEPIAAVYEQKRGHHVGEMPELEDELVQFTPQGYMGDRSPNRADWLIWAATELVGGVKGVVL